MNKGLSLDSAPRQKIEKREASCSESQGMETLLQPRYSYVRGLNFRDKYDRAELATNAPKAFLSTMRPSAVIQRTSVSNPGWGVLVLLALAGIAAFIFLIAFALPYFELNPEKLSLYQGKEGWIFLHIATGAVALSLGPFVLWHGLNRRRMMLHRRIGVAYMNAVAVSSVAGYYLAFHTNLDWVFGTGLTGLATAWVATTGLAYICIRRRLIEQHKEWMIRSYVVTLAFVNFRILVGVLQGMGVGTDLERLTAASWFCWAVPLLITELILQSRKIWKAELSSTAPENS